MTTTNEAKRPLIDRLRVLAQRGQTPDEIRTQRVSYTKSLLRKGDAQTQETVERILKERAMA